MTKPSLLAAAVLAVATSAAPAATYSSRTLSGAAAVSGDTTSRSGFYRATFVLPSTWKGATRGATLRYGPIGSCRSTIRWTARLVADGDGEATERARRLLPASEQYTYGFGTRGRASWRVIRVKGADTVRGLLTAAMSGWPGAGPGERVWIEVRADSRAATGCHTGGIRESVAFVVADAFGGMRATAFPRR